MQVTDASTQDVQAFQMDTSFCTRLWLLSTEVLIIALGGTMLLFSGHTLCHRRRLEQNPDMFKKYGFSAACVV